MSGSEEQLDAGRGNSRPAYEAKPFNAFKPFKVWFEDKPGEVFLMEQQITPYGAALALYKDYVNKSTVGDLLAVKDPIYIWASYDDASPRKEKFRYSFEVKIVLEWDSKLVAGEKANA